MVVIAWLLDLQLLVQSVHITITVVSYKVCLWLATGRSFLWVLRFPPPIKTDQCDIIEMLLKVTLNTIDQ